MDFSREFIFIDILKISVTLGLIPQYLASWLYGKIKPHGKFPLCFTARPLPRPACHLVAAPAPRVHPHVSIWGRFYPRRLYPTGLSNLHCSLTQPSLTSLLQRVAAVFCPAAGPHPGNIYPGCHGCYHGTLLHQPEDNGVQARRW